VRKNVVGLTILTVAALALLVASCVQSPEGLPTEGPQPETKDDEDPGGDPGIGSEPPWSWSPPSSMPSAGGSEGVPDPDVTGSVGAEPTWGCSPSHLRTCTDMYEDCRDRKYAPCNKKWRSGVTMCEICRENCQNNDPYKFKQCRQCGFSE